MQFEQVGMAFTQQYYEMFDSNREGLQVLYQADSMMTFEDTMLQGMESIMTHLCVSFLATVKFLLDKARRLFCGFACDHLIYRAIDVLVIVADPAVLYQF